MPLPAAVIPPLVAGGAAIAQGVITSAFNMNEAKKNRDFQERMSNTAHQREIADLRKANLNPILSAKLGGSSTPGGATAQATSPDVLHSALSAATTQAQIRDLNSAAALKDAQSGDILTTQMQRVKLLKAQVLETLQKADTTGLQRRVMLQQIENLEKQEKLLGTQIQHSAYDLDRAKNESDFNKTMGGDIAPWIKFIKGIFK